MAISWKSTKQAFIPTSSNHSKILALHEQVENVYNYGMSSIMLGVPINYFQV